MLARYRPVLHMSFAAGSMSLVTGNTLFISKTAKVVCLFGVVVSQKQLLDLIGTGAHTQIETVEAGFFQ